MVVIIKLYVVMPVDRLKPVATVLRASTITEGKRTDKSTTIFFL